MENPGNLLANYGASPTSLEQNEVRQTRRIGNQMNEYNLSSAIDDNQRKNQLRALAPKALEGDKNALTQMAGVDPDTALRMRDALSKMSAEERDLAAQKTLGVMRVAQLADTQEKWAQSGIGLPWEQRGQLIARGAALKDGYDAIVAAEKQTYDRGFDLKKLASEERRAMKGSATAGKPFKIGEDADGNPLFGQWDSTTNSVVPFDMTGVGGQQNTELSQAELDKARVELSTAGGKDKANDWIPFNEPSQDQVQARAWENRNGAGAAPGGTNILNTSPAENQAPEPPADPLLSQLQANRGATAAPTASAAEKAISTNKLSGSRSSNTARPSTNPARETAINQELNSIQSAMTALGDMVKKQGKMSPDIEAQIQQLNTRQNSLLTELKSIR